MNKYLYIPIMVACTLSYFALPQVGFTDSPSVSHAFAYSFSHCNIAHLAVNMLGLYYFKPRIKTSIVAYIVAVVVALCPWCAMDIPTYGLSAFLFACYARCYRDLHLKVWKLLAVQVACAIIPNINWRVHIASFLLSYLIWSLYYVRKEYR